MELENLLIVEADVGPPNMIWWDVEHTHFAVFRWFPLEFIVVPVLVVVVVVCVRHKFNHSGREKRAVKDKTHIVL